MIKIPMIYFISGVSGVGKTSVLIHFKRLLPLSEFDIRDFDERGVPDGGGPAWHDNETLFWLNIAAENAMHNKSTIICGFQNPQRFKMVHNKMKHPSAKLFLLHASGDTIRQRLVGRYPTPESVQEINRASGVPLEEFIENNVSFASTLRTIFENEGALVVETDNKTSEEVAKEIVGDVLTLSLI
jgi:hypothetical protein